MALTEGPIGALSIVAEHSFTEFREFVGPNNNSKTWMFSSSGGPVRISGLKSAGAYQIFAGALAKPLIQFTKETERSQAAVVAHMIESICGGGSIDKIEMRVENDTHLFDLTRGGAAIARRLGLFKTEVEFLRKAADLKKSSNIFRLLSYAYANIQDYPRAIVSARQATEADPDLEHGPFVAHLRELSAFMKLKDELKRLSGKKTPDGAPSSRIAYCLHNSRPYSQGGYANRSHSIAKAVLKKGLKLDIYPRPGFPSDSQSSHEKPNGLQTVENVDYYFENGFGRRGRAYDYINDASAYFERVFRLHNIGIVHAATNFWTSLPAAIAARRLGLPFIYEVRSFWNITREARSPGFAKTPQARRDDSLERIVLALADEILTLNHAMRDYIVEKGIDPRRITIVRNSVDSDQFFPAQPNPEFATQYGIKECDIVIGYMGAMLYYEGLDILIEAIAPLVRENKKIRLLIVGGNAQKYKDPSSIEYALLQQIKNYQVENQITLADRVSPHLAQDIYSLFDVCIYPRRACEVCELVSPLKPLEAMAAGKTVIGSSVGGLKDMIYNQHTGLIFEKENIDLLRATVKQAIEDEALRKRLGTAARQFVQAKRNWANAADQVANVYKRVLDSQPNGFTHLGTHIVNHFSEGGP